MKTFAEKKQSHSSAETAPSKTAESRPNPDGIEMMRQLLNRGTIAAQLKIGSPSDPSEIQADRVADAVVNGKGIAAHVENYHAPVAAKGKTHSLETDDFLSKANGGGKRSLNALESNYFESRFNSNFSHVRIHESTEAAKAASSINARAFTHGADIYLNCGEYNFSSQKGKRLLAHELAHVVQQRNKPVVQRKSIEEELEEELQAWALKKEKSWAKNEQTPDDDYIYDLKEYACELIAEKYCTIPKPKPESSEEEQKWERNFQKAEVLVDKIWASDSKEKDKEAQAQTVLYIMALAGFGDVAFQSAQKMKKPDYIYETILSQPEKLETETLTGITKYFIEERENDNPVVTELTDTTDSFEKKLTNEQLTAILEPLINKYKNDAILIEIVSEVLIFRKKYREIFSKWLWENGEQKLLFKILESEYFIEPKYGPTVLGSEDNALTLEDDMKWVYSNKQKYYVNFLVELGEHTTIEIKKPPNMEFETLREWIDTNTENFGKALSEKYPDNPEQWITVYEQLTDIFFYHTSDGVTADLSGKVKNLGKGAPNKIRLKADCDVLATYAMRFFSSIGAFKLIGYLCLIPKDEVEVGHAVALMRRNGTYYIISNKEVFKTTIQEKIEDEEKDNALKEMRDIALDLYYTPPNHYEVYYDDSSDDGSMSIELFLQKESTRRTDLEKAAMTMPLFDF